MKDAKGRALLLIAGVTLGIGLGCGGTQQNTSDQNTVPVTIASASASAAPSPGTPPSADAAEIPATSSAASKANRCSPAGPLPVLPERPKPAAPLPCRPAEVAAEKTITTDMKARYKPRKDKATAEVKFGCDGLDKAISRIVLERGGGHGGTLEIVELSRPDPASPSYDVTGIRLTGLSRGRAQSPFQIMSTKLPDGAALPKMPLLRAALRAEIKEIEPKPDPKARTGGGSGFGSSTNIHVLVRLEDAAGRSLAGHYTGYIDSSGQATYLPLQRAEEELQQILGSLSWRADPPPDEIKRLFEERFVDAQKRFSDQYAWWVREHYVSLAAHVGTRALIPALLPLLTPAKVDASNERTRDSAVEALVALTGWEPRAPKGGGKPRSSEEAARDFAEECGKIKAAAPSP